MSHLKKFALTAIACMAVFLQSCGIYSFSGASIAPLKTISVNFFENNAPLVVPYLSQQFTERLKERIRNQSSLNIVRTEGEGIFEGRITGYSITPVAITGSQRAGLNRLTVTVNVKFTNSLQPDLSFEQSFTRYQDFNVETRSIQAQEPELIRIINDQLTEDIFNRAFANW